MAEERRRVVIAHQRQNIGADCLDCGWQMFGDVRTESRQHARATGHRVHFAVEETTIYRGFPPAWSAQQ